LSSQAHDQASPACLCQTILSWLSTTNV
jgi:hypothetical protein